MSEQSRHPTALECLDLIDVVIDGYHGLPGEPGHHALVAIANIVALQAVDGGGVPRMQHGSERLITRADFIERGTNPLTLVQTCHLSRWLREDGTCEHPDHDKEV